MTRAARLTRRACVTRSMIMSHHTDERSVFESKMFRAVFDASWHQPRIQRIHRVPWPDHSQFTSEVAQAGYPIVFTGATQRDPSALMTEFSARFGAHTVLVRFGEYAEPAGYWHREFREMTLSDYLDYVVSPDHDSDLPDYAANNVLTGDIVEFLSTPPPIYYPSDFYRLPAMWLGPARTVTPLHKDSADNFVYHVFGQKRWVLYPVRDSVHLYLRRYGIDPQLDFAVSAVDLRAPDLTRFPSLLQAISVTATVTAGELLYIPMGWSHFVTALETTMTVNYFMDGTRAIPGILTSASLG